MIQYEVKAENDLNKERLTQVFNTALVTTRAEENQDNTKELYRLMDEAAFSSILQAIQLHASSRSISEVEAAREMIRTFRKIDALWTQFILNEGVERLKQT